MVGRGEALVVRQVVTLREKVRGVEGEEEGEELKVIPLLARALPVPGRTPPPTGVSEG